MAGRNAQDGDKAAGAGGRGAQAQEAAQGLRQRGSTAGSSREPGGAVEVKGERGGAEPFTGGRQERSSAGGRKGSSEAQAVRKELRRFLSLQVRR